MMGGGSMPFKKNPTSRHRGAALLMIVLVGFAVLSIISGVAINVAWRTLRAEAKQTQEIETIRTDALARSAVNTVIETANATSGDFFGGASNSISYESEQETIFSAPDKTTLKITLNGTARDYNVTAIVSADTKASSEIRADVLQSGDKYLITWRKIK